MRIMVVALVLAACGDNDGLSVDAAIPIDAAVVVDGAAEPPALALTVSSHDFGAVDLGQTATQMFTLTNTGGQVTGAPVAMVSNASWSITSPPCAMLQPHANCSIVVEFAPMGVGSSVAELSIEATPGGRVSTSLSGFGLVGTSDAQLAVSSQVLQFGTATVETVTASQTITVSNVGGLATGPLATTIGGAEPSQFTVVSDLCMGTTLQPAATCAVTVEFAPTVAASDTATVTWSASPGGFASTALTGTGGALDALGISPGSHDYGSIPANLTSAPQPFVVTNLGGEASGPLSPSLGGTNPSQFAITSSTCTGATLDPGASCTIEVTFAPTLLADDVAELDLIASPGGTVSAQLHGAGVSSELAFSLPAFATFAATAVGQVSAAQTLTVTNISPTTTGVAHFTLTGADPSQFQILSDTCTGNTLAANAQCAITLSFAPTNGVPSTKNAALILSANPGGTVSTQLTGDVLAVPVLSISPSLLDFGLFVTNEESASQPFVVTNVGIATTGPLAQSLGGANGSQFNITSSTCDGTTLAPNASCTIELRFAPTIEGLDQGSLDVTASPGGTASATLTGGTFGGPGFISMTSFVVFADTIVGQVSASQTITISNASTIADVPTVKLAGTDPTQFEIVSDTCTGHSFAPNAQCTITLAFTPTSDTPSGKNAVVDVRGTIVGGGSTALNGTALAVPAQLASSPAIDFGDVAAGDAVSASFTVTNQGELTTGTLTTTSSSGAEFATLLDSCNGATLDAGASCSIMVEFAPVTVGPHAESVTVSGAGTVTEPVSGNAIADGAFVAITGSEVFDVTAVGQASASKVITVSNIGVATTGVLASELTDASDFTIAADTCTGSTLAVGSECTITASFTPASAGAKSADLDLAASPGGVASVGLSGAATP